MSGFEPVRLGQALKAGENKYRDPASDVSIVASVTKPPNARLAALTILVSGNKIACAPEMITGLVEPHWIRVRRENHRIYVIVDGRDASESYVAIFTVVGGRIQERLFAQGEFRREIWERTIYHNDLVQHPKRYKSM